MVSNRDKWIRIFDIPATSKHRNGSTLYKIISMLYPQACPDAITKVTVWKRFNDLKKLHKEIHVLHRKLGLKSSYPNLPKSSLFKRFDKETIESRKKGILSFLEYVGNESQLFTSNEFVKFFETSHTPVDQLNSNINSIRADLHLPEDQDFDIDLAANSDEDHTISDTDSVTTISSLSPSVQTADCLTDNLNFTLHPRTKLKKFNSDSISIFSNISDILLDGHIYPTPPNTPGSSVTENYVQYIVDAAVHINLAVELENDRRFEEAFAAYKIAIDILLKHGKDDNNYDRKQMVRYKTEKYLLRAEKIYNMYMAPEVKDLEPVLEVVEDPVTKKPISDLYKYKVVKTVGSGMVVLHSDQQQLYYVKVIHKTVQFDREVLILPENVPYMVKLYNYHDCENALFIVLEYTSAVKLSDYLQRYSENPDEVFLNREDEILKQIQDLSDVESEGSYSDLVNDYSRKKSGSEEKFTNYPDGHDAYSSDDGFVKVEYNEFPSKSSKGNILDEPLRENSDKILLPFSCSEATSSVYQSEKNCVHSDDRDHNSSHRNLSEMSSFDIEEKNLIVPEKTVIKWAAQLLLALEKLHCLGVTCRSLQSKNLLIDENGDLVLTYMCNVKDLCDIFSNELNVNLAPEIYTFHDITKVVDWWSFGAILYELLVGMPLSTLHPSGVSTFTHLKIPRYVSPEGRSLLKQLLTFEPHDRLGGGINDTDNLKSHPFFSSVSWDSLLSKCGC